MRRSDNNLHLPEEIFDDILLRLPIKMLLACKLVCKQWCSLIESPGFVKRHFSLETNRERLLIRIGIFEQDDHGYGYQEYYLDGNTVLGYKYGLAVEADYLEYKEPHPPVHQMLDSAHLRIEYEEPPHLQMPDSVSHLIGPLNGVFCVVSHHWPSGPAGLLNPATRQFKPLPSFQGINPREKKFLFGLGLDPLTGDFKCVLISFSDSDSFVAVCTSASNSSWRYIEDSKPSPTRRTCGLGCNTYLNGVNYWLLDHYKRPDLALLAFDMRTEKFKKIDVTSLDDGDGKEWIGGALAVRRDSLVLAMAKSYGGLNECVEIWTMLNGGESWVRIARVFHCVLHYFDLDPVHFWKNDEVLIRVPTDISDILLSYNVRTRDSGSLRVDGYEWSGQHSPLFFNYKESIMPLKGGSCRLWDPSSDYIKDFFTT